MSEIESKYFELLRFIQNSGSGIMCIGCVSMSKIKILPQQISPTQPLVFAVNKLLLGQCIIVHPLRKVVWRHKQSIRKSICHQNLELNVFVVLKFKTFCVSEICWQLQTFQFWDYGNVNVAFQQAKYCGIWNNTLNDRKMFKYLRTLFGHCQNITA